MEYSRVHMTLLSVLLFALVSGGLSLTFTFQNNCGYTVWPGTLTGDNKDQLSSTGFELGSGASSSVDFTSGWSGRIWGRTYCTSSSSGSFSCETADCGSTQVSCNGAGANPPASLIEFTIGSSNTEKDFYDISLVDGFNLPLSVTPEGGSGDCQTVGCSGNINSVCPSELSVTGSDGTTIACKSACEAFGSDEYCCTGAYNTAATCPPTSYSQIFKEQCPQAYSYAYDDQTSTFTCTAANYLITFCPS
ncbi:thaumatin-like protein 1b isoform X1 [Telopea speciosissima]|uniref:thaumatin-like protein 1b isoform X1 n=1 Tax=Telopea speciosissima TaxID=54955 RepID=UPI001CC645AD|nr:thaumatin-like protein 1b isoform X1 [Telopea speciosissima]